MKELLTYIVQNLVDDPTQVSVTERKADGETIFEVRVADGDMGRSSAGRAGSLSRYASLCGPSPRERAKRSLWRSWTEIISCKEPGKNPRFFALLMHYISCIRPWQSFVCYVIINCFVT